MVLSTSPFFALLVLRTQAVSGTLASIYKKTHRQPDRWAQQKPLTHNIPVLLVEAVGCIPAPSVFVRQCIDTVLPQGHLGWVPFLKLCEVEISLLIPDLCGRAVGEMNARFFLMSVLKKKQSVRRITEEFRISFILRVRERWSVREGVGGERGEGRVYVRLGERQGKRRRGMGSERRE